MLRVFYTDQSTEWDSIVRSFEEYDTYWLSGYVKAFEIHGDGKAMLFYYFSESVRGINVVMKRDISECEFFKRKIDKNQFFDFSSPYGYGGWLLEGNDDKSELFSEYENWCKDNNIISEFVRFHPVIKNNKFCEEGYDITELGKTVSIDLSSSETIWNNFTSKNRNMIRKAQKNGVRIFNGRYPELYNEFKKIYDQTMDKDNADFYYYFSERFYESLESDLPYNAQVFFAEYDKKIIASAIMLASNGYMNYHLSGSLKEFSGLAPTNLLLYEASLWGNANGYKNLYLGGGVGSGEDSLFKFKKSFYRGENLNSFFIGKKIFDVEKYEMLLNLRSQRIEGNFFPLYRSKNF